MEAVSGFERGTGSRGLGVKDFCRKSGPAADMVRQREGREKKKTGEGGEEKKKRETSEERRKREDAEVRFVSGALPRFVF